MKAQVEKWEDPAVLLELHMQATYTAKTLTKEMIEGRTPIYQLIDQYKTVDKESVLTLLYRCDKLYRARSDVQKILMLMLKFEHDPNC